MPYSVVGCCEVDEHKSGLLLSRKAILDAFCQQGDLVYGRTPVSKVSLLLREKRVDDWLDTSLTTTTYVRRSGRITDGTRCGWTTLQRLHTFIPDTGTHPPEWPFQEQPGSGLTASAPVSDVSASACTNGLLCGLWVWRRGTNRRPCFPPMPSPSISSWIARPDGCGRCDKRMAAQHLPWGLVRPISGQQQLALTTKWRPAFVYRPRKRKCKNKTNLKALKG